MYRVSDTVRSTHGLDGAVVLDIGQGQMYNLNFVGSRILELIKAGGLTESEIVAYLSREFGVSPEVLKSDVHDFIEALKQHGLVCETTTAVQHRAEGHVDS